MLNRSCALNRMNTVLKYDKGGGSALKELISEDFYPEALILGKTANIISRDILQIKQDFQGKVMKAAKNNLYLHLSMH